MSPPPFDFVMFDADDTLWHSETYFETAQGEFRDLIVPYVEGGDPTERLYAFETRNLAIFGYGVKGFTLSMIETAIELTEGRVPADAIQKMIDIGKALHDHPIDLLDGVAETLDRVAATGARLGLVTKGDLFHQEVKIAGSGLADRFDRIEIVSEKSPEVYRRILEAVAVAPVRAAMVGNSPRSDILPVIDIGGAAVHVPYRVTWAHEQVDLQTLPPRAARVDAMAEVPAALHALAEGRAAS